MGKQVALDILDSGNLVTLFIEGQSIIDYFREEHFINFYGTNYSTSDYNKIIRFINEYTSFNVNSPKGVENLRDVGRHYYVTLEDDDSEFGGVSFYGETLKDFLIETRVLVHNLMEVNEALADCGIRPISKGGF